MKAYAYCVTFKKQDKIVERIVLGDCMNTALGTFDKAYPPSMNGFEVVAIDNLGQLADSREIIE